jgi:hypothetical protein
MIPKWLPMTLLFASAASAFGETLVSGSVYFDSQKTLEEVVKLSAQKDNASILKLINNGHVSQQIGSDQEIVVLVAGLSPESPAEFRFSSGPTTYWTLTKFIAKTAAPTPTPEPSSTPEPSPTPAAQRKQKETEKVAPFDDDNGRKIWHQVDGKWKWQRAKRRHSPAKKASPREE